MPDLSVMERVWDDVMPIPNSGCWVWMRSLNPKGYPQMSFGGRVRVLHRLVYQTLRGPIPVGLQLDHKCRVRSCVNPDHLEPVTGKENVARGLVSGHTWSGGGHNARKTNCPKGHPYNDANTYIVNGRRQCRQCGREAALRRYHRIRGH